MLLAVTAHTHYFSFHGKRKEKKKEKQKRGKRKKKATFGFLEALVCVQHSGGEKKRKGEEHYVNSFTFIDDIE